MTSVGLQTQYEAVCENLGLIAYLVQVLVVVITIIIIIIAYLIQVLIVIIAVVIVNIIDKSLNLEKRVFRNYYLFSLDLEN